MELYQWNVGPKFGNEGVLLTQVSNLQSSPITILTYVIIMKIRKNESTAMDRYVAHGTGSIWVVSTAVYTFVLASLRNVVGVFFLPMRR
jgi:hypothetical protein